MLEQNEKAESGLDVWLLGSRKCEEIGNFPLMLYFQCLCIPSICLFIFGKKTENKSPIMGGNLVAQQYATPTNTHTLVAQSVDGIL